MKKIHTVTTPAQFPIFWDEEWLKVAIDELDRRKMTPDERASFEILIARNAEAVKAENRKIKEAQDEVKFETVKNLINLGILTSSQIAQTVGVSEAFVMSIMNKK